MDQAAIARWHTRKYTSTEPTRFFRTMKKQDSPGMSSNALRHAEDETLWRGDIEKARRQWKEKEDVVVVVVKSKLVLFR